MLLLQSVSPLVEQGYTVAQAQQEAERCICKVDTVFICDLCGGDPECVKWCASEALTIKDVEFPSPARKSVIEERSKLLLKMQGMTKASG